MGYLVEKLLARGTDYSTEIAITIIIGIVLILAIIILTIIKKAKDK